ncbi:Redoxin [Kalmanozyma brasiliensis GHG001]|uniref:Redoxin domain-containing protein n=1 Tax=Kalmanozyma brasiliensis (strain GHG001) TaxID=1365824 RepID=V5GGG4_KALBG|nr:Redoxin [Kalmanozyma brasiliensis GHG001]EST05072.1 Redoxin [Kalmanozyma brasiliensis GHG001]
MTVEIEDRAAFHLLGHPLPALIDLASTSGTTVDLFTLSLRQPIMLFLYPSTASPLRPTPAAWSTIPGATGCTPHLTSIPPHIPRLLVKQPSLAIFGLSTQAHVEQVEAKQRLNLPFGLLSDEKEELLQALEIPSFELEGKRYFRRMTLLLQGGQITRLDYPIHVPQEAGSRAEGLLRTEQELMDEVEARDAAAAASQTQA